MVKKNTQIRIDDKIYLIESLDDNACLLSDGKGFKSWVSKKDLAKSLKPLVFENYSYKSDALEISLYNNDIKTIIDVNDNGKHYYRELDKTKSQALKEFQQSFKYLNEVTAQKLLRKGFTNDKPTLNEGFNAQVFYHGSHTNHIKDFTVPAFWSTDPDFANSWGNWIYKAQLNLGQIFDIALKKHFNWLLEKAGGKISYIDDETDEVNYLVAYNQYKKIAENNWQVVEHYKDIIKSGGFNSCRITEWGTINYMVFDNSQIKLLDKTARMLDESVIILEDAKVDYAYRKLAGDIAYEIVQALLDKKTKTEIYKEAVTFDITKTIKDIFIPFKHDERQFMILLQNKSEGEGFMSYASSKDVCTIMLNCLPKSVGEICHHIIQTKMPMILKKTNKAFENKPSSNDDMMAYATDVKNEYVANYCRSLLKKFFNENNLAQISLVHECIHLIDDFRRHKNYKPKKQDISNIQGITDYMNGSDEQNAYFQETASVFDKFFTNCLQKGYFPYGGFKPFFIDFVKQYYGVYQLLNRTNREKLAKRAYKLYIDKIENFNTTTGKELTETLIYNDEFNDEDGVSKFLKVWKNPSPQWIKDTLPKTEYNAYRFIYDNRSKALYVWDASIAIHVEVEELLGISGNIYGTLGIDEVDVAPYISDNESLEEAVEITKKDLGYYLEQIYGDLDRLKWGVNS